KKQSALDLGFQDTVLRSQIFVPQQQFLIDGAGDVGQHASPVHSRASLNLIVEPGLYMLLRFQKAAGRGNYETGNQAFSKCLRFLTIRGVDGSLNQAILWQIRQIWVGGGRCRVGRHEFCFGDLSIGKTKLGDAGTTARRVWCNHVGTTASATTKNYGDSD